MTQSIKLLSYTQLTILNHSAKIILFLIHYTLSVLKSGRKRSYQTFNQLINKTIRSALINKKIDSIQRCIFYILYVFVVFIKITIQVDKVKLRYLNNEYSGTSHASALAPSTSRSRSSSCERSSFTFPLMFRNTWSSKDSLVGSINQCPACDMPPEESQGQGHCPVEKAVRINRISEAIAIALVILIGLL